MPRLCSEYGIHRGPTVGLAVVGALLAKYHDAVVDLFPMSLVKEAVWGGELPQKPLWQGEAFRLQKFLTSGFPACQLKVTVVCRQ